MSNRLSLAQTGSDLSGWKGAHIKSRHGDETGVATGSTRHCRMEGAAASCGGVLVGWPPYLSLQQGTGPVAQRGLADRIVRSLEVCGMRSGRLLLFVMGCLGILAERTWRSG